MPKKNRHQTSQEELEQASGGQLGIALQNLEGKDATVQPGKTFKPKDGENYDTLNNEGGHLVLGG